MRPLLGAKLCVILATCISSGATSGATLDKVPYDFTTLDSYFLFKESSETSLQGDLDITEEARAQESICGAVNLFKQSLEKYRDDWTEGYYLSGDWTMTMNLVFINDRNEYAVATSVLDYGRLVLRNGAANALHDMQDVTEPALSHLADCLPD